MFWILFFGIILFLLLWLLFAPIYFRVEWNDNRRQAALQWRGIFQARLHAVEGEWEVQLNVLFFKKRWPLMRLLTAPSKPKKPKAKRSSSKSWKPKHPFRMFRRLWRSFHLIRFRWHLDTDDYVLNAYLFPLFQLTHPKKKLDWAINFNGKNELLLVIENRLGRILYAFISSSWF